MYICISCIFKQMHTKYKNIYIYNIISTDNIDIPITHSMIKIITDVQHVSKTSHLFFFN